MWYIYLYIIKKRDEGIRRKKIIIHERLLYTKKKTSKIDEKAVKQKKN